MKQIWTEKGGLGPVVILQPCLYWVNMGVLMPPQRVSTFSGILAGNTPPPPHTALQLSPGVMGDEDVSCHSIQNRVSLNPVLLSAERPAAGPPPPRVDKHPGTSPLASPCLGCEQANLSPSCFIYTWCLLPLTWILTLRVGGISRKTTFVVCR